MPIARTPPDFPSPISMSTNGVSQGQKPNAHLHTVAVTWHRLQNVLRGRSKVILDGMSLTIADVVAVAQYALPEDNLHSY
jgi:hypothetical protein